MADDVNDTLGARIKQLRREQGLTQRKLSEAVGIDFTYLSKVENDRGETPGEDTIRKLAKELDADPEEFLALAGKVPTSLREKAQGDVEFATFLRRLPDMSKRELEQMYRRAKRGK